MFKKGLKLINIVQQIVLYKNKTICCFFVVIMIIKLTQLLSHLQICSSYNSLRNKKTEYKTLPKIYLLNLFLNL